MAATEVPHKGGRTFGFRISDGTSSVAYVPDHLPGTVGPDGVALVAGVDVLIHDGQFLTAESALARDYGHATVDEAVALALAAGVGHLVLFHHSPGRSDDRIDRILASVLRSDLTISAAVEGRAFAVPETVAGSRRDGSVRTG